ncbi:MAG: DUF192 domain-containing protein [Phycisphaerales bacterium]|nr:DUF192 domain-containing protein [Phycisphaerales bacterium]
MNTRQIQDKLLGACLLLTALLTAGCGCETGPTEPITIAGQPFVLEVVSTDEAIQRGLGGREHLGDDEGMLFVFPDPQPRRFWMKNCLIDIDIMFLDGLGRITAIHTMPAEPLKGENESQEAYETRLKRYTSQFGAQFAIELRSGRIDELGLTTGNKVDIPIDCLKARLD